MDDTAAEFLDRHFSLPTQQRRLRHLRSIALRNVSTSPETCGAECVTQFLTHFTLHEIGSNKVIYESEKIKGSLNPTWKSFCLEQFGTDTFKTATSVFIVRVWRGNGNRCSLIIKWTVDLFGLKYLGRKFQKEGYYASNSLIFGLLDGYYGAPNEEVFCSSNVEAVAKSVMKVDQNDVKESYSINSLSRIQTVLRAIKQTQNSVHKIKSSIEDQLAKSQDSAKREKHKELMTLCVSQMRCELEWRTMQLQNDKEILEQLRAKNHQKDVTCKNKIDTLRKDKTRLHDKKKSYFDVREDLIKTGAALVMRRKQLISELAHIYPINELQNGEYTVCGVQLPNSENFNGQDEAMIAIALGYTCHLVQMISQFLDVPLRYIIDHHGSKSIIFDHILDKLSDKDRGFPLYRQGKERFQFNYGVYLLNKNIAQLRYYCGLGTTDLRLTLPNLKSLLELRLGVRFDTTSVLAGHHVAIPPNLGGPQKYNLSFQHHLIEKVNIVEMLTDDEQDTRPDKKWPDEDLLESRLFTNSVEIYSIRDSEKLNVGQSGHSSNEQSTFRAFSSDICNKKLNSETQKLLEITTSSTEKEMLQTTSPNTVSCLISSRKQTENGCESSHFISGSSLSDPIPLKHKMVDATKEDTETHSAEGSSCEESFKSWHPSIKHSLHKSNSNALLEDIETLDERVACDANSVASHNLSCSFSFKTSAMLQKKENDSNDVLSDLNACILGEPCTTEPVALDKSKEVVHCSYNACSQSDVKR